MQKNISKLRAIYEYINNTKAGIPSRTPMVIRIREKSGKEVSYMTTLEKLLDDAVFFEAETDESVKVVNLEDTEMLGKRREGDAEEWVDIRI